MASITTTPADTSLATARADKAYRRRVWAWALYDVADHSYITTFASTFFPPYFIAIAAPALLAQGGTEALARDTASNYYAFVTSLALFLAAIIAPIIVQYAGVSGGALVAVWIVAIALLGVLAWAIVRSKANIDNGARTHWAATMTTAAWRMPKRKNACRQPEASSVHWIGISTMLESPTASSYGVSASIRLES